MKGALHCLSQWLIVLFLLALVGLILVLPWQERHAFYQDGIDERTAQLRHYDAIIAMRPGLEQQLAALRDSKEIETYYIAAPDSASGGIALQRRVEDFVRVANINLSSVQVLPPEEQPEATRMGLRLRFGCSVDALWRLLYSIESTKPLLMVASLSVRVMRQGPRQFNPGIPDTTPDLNVNMDVYGYIRQGKS